MRNIISARRTKWLVVTLLLGLILLAIFVHLLRRKDFDVEQLHTPSPPTEAREIRLGLGSVARPPTSDTRKLSPEDALDKSWQFAQQTVWPTDDRAYYLLAFCQTASSIRSKRYPNACWESFRFAEHNLPGCQRDRIQMSSVIALARINLRSAIRMLGQMHPSPACPDNTVIEEQTDDR